MGFEEGDTGHILVKVHHNCDADLLEICSHDEECVDEGAFCAIPHIKHHQFSNVGKRIEGLARCICDPEHSMKYLVKYISCSVVLECKNFIMSFIKIMTANHIPKKLKFRWLTNPSLQRYKH